MTAKSASELGFTPAKIGMVLGLSVLLIGSLVYQFSGSTSPSPAIQKRVRPNVPGSVQTSNNSEVATNSTAGRATSKWPDLPVDEVARFDPFAFPVAMSTSRLRPGNAQSTLQSSNSNNGQFASTDLSAYPDAKNPSSGEEASGDSRPQDWKRRVEEQRAVAAELQRRGVGVILRTSSGSVAHIGDLQLRVGDVLNGLRVAEIGQDGIRLVAEPAEVNDSATHP